MPIRSTSPSVTVARRMALRRAHRRAAAPAPQPPRRRRGRDHYQRFLARFGVSSFEELSMIGTGFGDTTGDVAIREAATVVSMAEQRCAQLRAALDAEDEADPPASHTGAAATEPRQYRLELLTADEAAELLARGPGPSRARCVPGAARRRPRAGCVQSRCAAAPPTTARSRIHANGRSSSWTACDQVAEWAAAGAAGDVALALGGVPASTPG